MTAHTDTPAARGTPTRRDPAAAILRSGAAAGVGAAADGAMASRAAVAASASKARTRWDANEAVQAYRLRREGLDAEQIGARLGRSEYAVRGLFRRLRAKEIAIPVSRPGPKPIELDPEKLREWRAARRTFDWIGAQCGVSHEVVRRRCRELGIHKPRAREVEA